MSKETPVPPLPGASLMLRALVKRGHAVGAASTPPLHSLFSVGGIDPAHLRRYQRAFGFTPERVPLTYYYLMSQRAHLATLLQPDFPHRIIGMVHLENSLRAHATPLPGQAIVLHSSVVRLAPTASQAVLYALETVAHCAGTRLFTCSSTYLALRGQRRKGAPPTVQAAPGQLLADWTLSAASGRAYAWLSGDFNPIHLGVWPARLLGLPAPVIHGMHTAASVCAQLESAMQRQVSTLSIAFTAALTLGSAAQLRLLDAPGAYAVHSGGVRVAHGSFGLADSDEN